MNSKGFSSLLLLCPFALGTAGEPFKDNIQLFEDLKLVDEIDKSINDRLPFLYNYNVMGGYLNMPSARMNKMGSIAFGGGKITPYINYGLNFQFFDRLELSGNYRVYNGILEGNFGHLGFGDDADRIGNLKFGLITPKDGIGFLPSVAVGAEDFMGTQRFKSQYIVLTKEFIDWNFEISFGWGRERIKGPFGGIAITPWRKTLTPFFKDLTFIAEYDAYDYKNHIYEHPNGRAVKSRVNAGISFVGWDTLQITCSSVRGKDFAASASLRYPLGTTKGFFAKTEDPQLYSNPLDTEPLGLRRPEQEFAQELAYALKDQGLDLYQVYLIYNDVGEKELWLKIVNNRYREQEVVRERLQNLLSRLIPSNITAITILIEADALPCFSYRFRKEELKRYQEGKISSYELEIASPMQEAIKEPGEEDAALLFHRKKASWSFLFRPRLLTFFGSSTGKFKYNLSLIASPEGYIFDQVYYKIQVRQTLKSSFQNLADSDRLNPSQLPNVRTDTIKYFQNDKTALEMAYIQKGFNHGYGLFSRVACGYFEPAYGGLAAEMLYSPTSQSWAIGFEAATVMKRQYTGLGFTDKIRILKGHIPHYIPFVGVQYSADLYYLFRPLMVDFKFNIGQFLARDKGIRTEVGKTYANGLRVALWYTVTNGHDHVNGHTYYDKGFMFSIPIDFFLKKTKKDFVGYAMSAWLRDVGAQAETGKKLWTTLSEERY